MPAMATARPTDDFDMAKLQKSLKQRQRLSIRNKHHVAKLTPAEIRSLNNGSLGSITNSQSDSKGSSPSTSRRSTNATPPTSPEDGTAVHPRHSISRNSSIDVPTPPHTPNGRRRSSQSSTHSHHHVNHHVNHHVHHGHSNGIIYAPRPKGHVQAAFMVSNGVSSRPSSSGSSTYRGLPTYRGPEVTRTGSMNMLQRPSPTIVSNPLSNFSRPRQSMFGTSPERSRHDSLTAERPTHFQNGRANSFPTVSAASSRPASPPRVTDSPVSMIDDTEKFPAFDPNDPHNQPKDLSEEEDNQVQSFPQLEEPETDIAPARPVSPVPITTTVEPMESPKKDKQKRFTLGTTLFGGDKAASNDSHEKGAKLKKTRRRTLSSGKNGASPQTSPTPESPGSPADEKTVDGAGLEDFSAHPAIRPLSLVIPTEEKGKGKEISSAPVISRCSCCGKAKKPAGFTNELSPVLENENLRTNFSFELERTSGSSGRRSSDASRGKFTPIIPIAVSATETRQATIEPYTPSSPTANTVANQKSSLTTSPRRFKKHLDPPKFVRFASLHGKRNVDSTIIAEEEEDVEIESKPLMNGSPEDESHENYENDFPAVNTIARSQPVIDGPAYTSIPTQDFQHENIPVLHRPSDAGSSDTNNDVFFTPARGTSPAVQTNGSDSKTSHQQPPPFDRERSFKILPESNLGIDFKDFVVPAPIVPGFDSADKDRKWTPEVMAA